MLHDQFVCLFVLFAANVMEKEPEPQVVNPNLRKASRVAIQSDKRSQSEHQHV